MQFRQSNEPYCDDHYGQALQAKAKMNILFIKTVYY
jgi:hypothetical protein